MGGVGSGRKAKAPYQRFMALFKYSEIGCWNWRGRLRGSSPKFWDGIQSVAAPRWIWEHLNGPVPEGGRIVRTCKNSRCVRPSHLELRMPKTFEDDAA